MMNKLLLVLLALSLSSICVADEIENQKVETAKVESTALQKTIEISIDQFEIIMKNIKNGAPDILAGTGLVYAGSLVYVLSAELLPAYAFYIPATMLRGSMASPVAIMVGGMGVFGYGAGMAFNGLDEAIAGGAVREGLVNLMMYCDKNYDELITTRVGRRLGEIFYDLVH